MDSDAWGFSAAVSVGLAGCKSLTAFGRDTEDAEAHRGHRGLQKTEEQKNRRTEEQKNRRTEEQKNRRRASGLLGDSSTEFKAANDPSPRTPFNQLPLQFLCALCVLCVLPTAEGRAAFQKARSPYEQ